MGEISRFLLIFAEAQKAVGVLKSPWRQGPVSGLDSGPKRGKIARFLESNELCLGGSWPPQEMDKTEREEKSRRETGDFLNDDVNPDNENDL